MAEFLTTSGTSHNIENIIIEAKTKLVLVSPYLKLSKTFYERLKDASDKGVKITIIFGKDELKPNEKNSLAALKNTELYFSENLHAKCYFNETTMVITSMNMYEFSEKNNREMGVLIDRNIDRALFEKAVNETLSIIHSSEHIPLGKADRKISTDNRKTSDNKISGHIRGYCIRCTTRVSFNPDKPYCLECYSVWAQYENPDYKEDVCHRCGEFEESSMNKPLCHKCYKDYQDEKKHTYIHG